MQIKKFIAPTLKEATFRMKDELGIEAVILGTKVIEGDAGFGMRRMFEITAGIEDDQFVEKEENNGSIDEKPIRKYNTDPVKRSFVQEMDEISKKFNKKTPPQSTVRPDVQKAEPVAESMEKEIKEVVETLHNKDVHKKVIASVVAELDKYKNFLHASNLDNYVLSALSSMIPTQNFELKKSGKPRIISFVGPTGVGKTTCIAKLAVIAKILHNLDVGLISIDTYRLGAIDQLKIFSEISKTDLLVAYEPAEMERHLYAFRKKDIIFIDTAGRSPKNTEQLQKTKDFLDVMSNETFLVLSATSTTKSMLDAADKFGLFNYSSFIFTKIDEAVTFGNIVNVTSNTNKPVVYLSNGQTIPDDIISADPEFIASMIYTGNYLNVRAS